jgi:hypothetical protein
VNDLVDDQSRQDLLPLVPAVIDIGRVSCSAVVVATASEFGLTVSPDARSLIRARNRAIRRAGSTGGWSRITEQMYSSGPARRAVLRCVETVKAAGSGDLHEMLANCVVAARRAGSAADLAAAAPASMTCGDAFTRDWPL